MASTGSNSSVQETDAAASQADIVVALTSYNDVRTVGAVTRAVRDGLSRHFGSSDARILLADAGSTDGTREAARDAAGSDGLIEVEYSSSPTLAEMPYHGQPCRAAALRTILQVTQNSGAKACAVLDARLDTLEPDWVARLLEPVLHDGFDYVSPYYVRRVEEGAMTKGIVYPMFRALYGVRLRQPAAVEFGCSAALLTHLLDQHFWDLEQAQVAVDLWLAVTAACDGFRTCEASLGVRHAAARERPSDLSTILAQIVGALFTDLEGRVDTWQRTRGSQPTPIVGPVPVVADDSDHIATNELMDSFRLGYRELREIWTWVLPPRTIVELRKLTETPPDRFRFEDRLWAGIIYDFGLAYSFHLLPRDHLLRSLTPLYAGWMASFVLQLKSASLEQVEARIEQLCLVFEAEKRYLISRWRWPERLR